MFHEAQSLGVFYKRCQVASNYKEFRQRFVFGLLPTDKHGDDVRLTKGDRVEVSALSY
jgi:hypothetical protein